MTTQSILKHLTTHHLITHEDHEILKSKKGEPAFLRSLVKIYTDKTELYLSACDDSVREALPGTPKNQLEALTLEKTIDCALGVFLESEKFAVIPSMRLLLAGDEALSISLGVKPSTQTLEIAKQAMIGLIARYRLLRSVDVDLLQTLVQNVDKKDPQIFPLYFFNALRIEKEFALAVMQDTTVKIPYSSDLVTACARGIIFYLGTLIKNAKPSQPLLNKYFHYLSTDATHLAFANGMTEGFADKMGDAQEQLKVLQAHTALLSSPLSAICLPAISLLDIPVEVNLSALENRLQVLRNQIQENAQNLDSFNRQVNEARQTANRKIDEWRASIPDRPITFGIQVGPIPFNLK